MREINAIVIHAADTPADMDIGAAEIREWHVDGNGWDDIGYHYVIRRDGALEHGRDLEVPGAHVRGHNQATVGVCLVGGRGTDGTADANFTRKQWSTLEALVKHLAGLFPDARVCGHRDLDPGKACPCFDAGAWWGSE